MFAGKYKALTFSYDDAVTQDQRFIKLLNKYGMKCTFNINSQLLGSAGMLRVLGNTVAHVKPKAQEIKKIYEGHEIAAHTLTHLFLPSLSDEEIIKQVEEDRKNLSEIAGYDVVGFAYPCGGENYNSHVAEVIKNNTGIKYARTIVSNGSFEPQENLYEFKPTIYHFNQWDNMFETAQKFIDLKSGKPQIMYVWGHTYELDLFDGWEQMEEFLKMLSSRDDIFYGTNKQVLLGE